MRILDLTHTISENMPVYPGTKPPILQLANTIAVDQFKETLLTMYSHTGTHMDAPAHVFENRTSLDAFDISQFVGQALVIDCTELAENASITMEQINPLRDLADKAEFLLFSTGWEKYWNSEAYFGNFPCIAEDVAEYIIQTGKKGIGLDTISVDPMASLDLHRKLLANNEIVIIENLKNLCLVGAGLFTFCALPLKFAASDGAPIRAIAMIE